MPSSRSDREVQGRDAAEFGALLGGVFRECARVLKPEGVLAFTFHHSRNEAWLAVAQALEQAGFEVAATHPVKAEMSVGVPKHQAREPINLDLVIVCKHRNERARRDFDSLVAEFGREASATVERYNTAGTLLSQGDIRVILMGAFLKAQSLSKPQDCASRLNEWMTKAESLYQQQELPKTIPEHGRAQLRLEF
jgi:putative DNA methylase